jgi:O-antigen/teichoic acid export membrane protein
MLSEPDRGVPLSPSESAVALNLTRTLSGGVAWSTAARLLINILQFGSTIIVARLVSPYDYGLAAIVATIVGFAVIVAEMGVGSALVHQKDASGSDLAAAFWLTAIAAWGMALLVAGLAYPAAAFFGQEELAPLMLLGAPTLALGVNVVHLALLQRQLRFVEMAVVEVIATAGSVGVTIACAAAGMGARSLIIGGVALVLFTTLGAVALVPWRPVSLGSKQSYSDLWRYARHLLGFNVVNYFGRNAANIALGKWATPAALGHYGRAYNLMMLPVSQVIFAVGRVLFPTLVQVREDPDRFRSSYVRVLVITMAAATPLGLGLAVTAPALIPLLYGPGWEPVIPVLIILAASVPAQVLAGTTGALYQAMGRTKSQLARGLSSTGLTVVAVAGGIHWGVLGVAVGLLLRFYLTTPLMTAGCWPFIGLYWRDVARKLAPVMAGAFAMVVTCVLTGLLLHNESHVVVLLGQAGIGALTYCVVLALVGREIVGEVRVAFAALRDRSAQQS